MKKPKTRNPVAHHINRFNKPSIHKDKKKAFKQGLVKHKAELRVQVYQQAA